MNLTAPGSSHRTVIIGRTGSGKTQAGLFHLSSQDFHKRPWIIFDWKGDKLIAKIKPTWIDIRKDPPRKPGLYVVRPLPNDEKTVTSYLWKVWANEKTGLYIDEGFMMGRFNAAYRAILTQGRSKHIPVITLTQRPAWLDQFVFTEANFFQVFHLNALKDRIRVAEFVPSFDTRKQFEPYHSIWYDVDNHHSAELRPVPSASSIVAAFKARVVPSVRAL